MSALNTFAEKLTEEGMSDFELSAIRFSIVKRNSNHCIAPRCYWIFNTTGKSISARSPA